MRSTNSHLYAALLCLAAIYLPATRANTFTGPAIELDCATVLGTRVSGVDSFLGIPFAKPPLGNLRFRLPQLLTSYHGIVNATTFGNQCLAQNVPLPTDVPSDLLQDVGSFLTKFPENASALHSEDCLNINVIRPANISTRAKLPVVAWIYGGGFTQGSNAQPNLNGSAIVMRSIEIGEPIIYVAMNYRLNAFGFLGGKEIEEAGVGNLGLQDQRAALRWINKFISAFGGDPEKVTIWGESAGSISVALQMLSNDGNPEGLFRAAIMDSGSLLSTGQIVELQETYDIVVDEVGCSRASNTLACLRTVSADSLLAAVNNTVGLTNYTGLASPYMPRADGFFLKEPSQELALKGKLAKIPFIIGDVKDEGTIFSIGITNVTTDNEFAEYISHIWFPGASLVDVKPILQLYPANPAAGSPFDTGDANSFTPQYKRISALQGDWFFHAPRRLLLDQYSARQPTYNYLITRTRFTGLGVAHGGDLLITYGQPGDMTDYFIRFITNLNPNTDTALQWPQYNRFTRSTLRFGNDQELLTVISDIERLSPVHMVTNLSLRFPF